MDTVRSKKAVKDATFPKRVARHPFLEAYLKGLTFPGPRTHLDMKWPHLSATQSLFDPPDCQHLSLLLASGHGKRNRQLR